MEKDTVFTEEENDLCYDYETIRTTPEDGFVPDRKTRPVLAFGETRGKSHVGYQNTRFFPPMTLGQCALLFTFLVAYSF